MRDVLMALGLQIAAILAPVVAAALVAVLVRGFKRLGVDLSAAQEAQLQAHVVQAICFAEEGSAKAALSGNTKLTIARGFLRTAHPELSPATADNLIHAALPAVRAQLAGTSTAGVK